jgi:hypothetical protein
LELDATAAPTMGLAFLMQREGFQFAGSGYTLNL